VTRARNPWRSALRRLTALPLGVVGPVAFNALRRLAAICFLVAMSLLIYLRTKPISCLFTYVCKNGEANFRALMEGYFGAPCPGASDRWFHFRLPNSTIARGFVRERLIGGCRARRIGGRLLRGLAVMGRAGFLGRAVTEGGFLRWLEQVRLGNPLSNLVSSPMLQVRLRNARDPVIWIHSKEASGFAYWGKLHIDLDVYAFPVDVSLPRPSRDPSFFHKDV